MAKVMESEVATVSGTATSRSRLFAVAELALAAAFMVLAKLHLLPRPDTLWLFALGWISLRVRHLGWKGVGLRRPGSWGFTILVALVTAIILQLVSLWITVPLATQLTGKPPDLSEFRELVGNTKLVLLGLLVVWTLAALGEEMAFRGYLMSRVADLGGGSRAAWVTSYFVMSIVFGLGHLYQGPSGVIDSTVSGLVFGGLYLRFNRNLWPAIFAHGMTDTIGLLMVYFGWTPGVKI